VLFHSPPLFQGKRAWFLKQAGWQAHFADVMKQTAKMCKLLFLLAELQTFSDISGVNGYDR